MSKGTEGLEKMEEKEDEDYEPEGPDPSETYQREFLLHTNDRSQWNESDSDNDNCKNW